MSIASRFGAAKAAVTNRWRALRARRPSVRHVASAWGRMQDNNGNQYAAAITYFSFLALFPLLLLGVAVTGFVLHAHPGTQQSLFDHITANIPGEFGDTLKKSIRSAIQARTSVGIVGLAGVLLTGLGWIGNLRAAVAAVWGRALPEHNFVVAKALNLMVLAGLAVGTLISLALTAGGTALSDQVLRWLSLDGKPGTHTLVTVLGIALAVLGDMVIFSWLLVRLPGAEVHARVAAKGALLAAVGFEVLKVAGAYTIKRSASSPTAGPFASVVAILIWIQLVARWMLLCAAWMSVLTDERNARPAPSEPEPATGFALSGPVHATLPDATLPDATLPDATLPDATLPDGTLPDGVVRPAAVGATIFGAGVVTGAAATWLATRRPPS